MGKSLQRTADLLSSSSCLEAMARFFKSCLLCKKVCRYLLEGVSVIPFIRAQLQALCHVSLVGLWVMILCWLVHEEAI